MFVKNNGRGLSVVRQNEFSFHGARSHPLGKEDRFECPPGSACEIRRNGFSHVSANSMKANQLQRRQSSESHDSGCVQFTKVVLLAHRSAQADVILKADLNDGRFVNLPPVEATGSFRKADLAW